MKRKHLYNLLVPFVSTAIVLFSTQCGTQDNAGTRPPVAEQAMKLVPPEGFFPKKDLMKIGVYYYPEQWPHDQWERDLNNISRLGFEFTHFAEFSWVLLEPEEGKFDFSWLDEAVDLASRAGLKVIMCTPTLCPPAWMSEKYPEIYLTGADGRRREHGNRANASITNPVYRNYCDKIVAAMAEHYSDDKRIWGWQVDNEPLAVPDYSPSARKSFQEWLLAKYQTIEALNSSWGGNFWSTGYDNFEQVLIPNAAMAQEDKLSPHSLLDFKRFTADATAGFLNRQADILREHILPSQWITTNYTNVTIDSDPRRSERVDFPTFTMYPVNGKNELGGNNFRTGVPYKIYEACDYYRSIKGITALMELQPGQINWAQVNPQPLPGAIHMWILQAFGGGCSFLCTYRYRHPMWSSEMYHEGIVGTDGITLTQGGKEFVQAVNDIKILRNEYDSTALMPESLAKRKTAILWSHDVMWDLDIQPQTTSWNTWRNRNNYTYAVKSAGAPMDFISENDDFSKYPFIIAPSYQLIDSALLKKWQKYTADGGHLILTCRTGYKDKNGHFHESQWAEPVSAITGSSIEFFDMLPPGNEGTVRFGKNDFKWDAWSEILSPSDETEVIAAFSDQFYSGKAAVTTRKIGKGSVTYIGVATSSGELEREVVREVYRRAGVNTENFPRGVFMEWRDGFYVAVNYTDNNYYIPLPGGTKIFAGKNPLEPAGALIWK